MPVRCARDEARERRDGTVRTINDSFRRCGEIMIGPPGLPKFGRRVFAFAKSLPQRSNQRRHAGKWLVCFYAAGVLAHYSHFMSFGLPSLDEALMQAPVSLVWPADLIGTLMDLG